MKIRLSVVVAVLSLLMAACEPQTSPTTSTTSPSPLAAPESGIQKTSVKPEGKVAFHHPRHMSFQELSIRKGAAWHEVEPIQGNSVLFLEPGEYRYRVSTPALTKALTGAFAANDLAKTYFMHYYPSPDQSLVYVWPSAFPAGSTGFTNEKLRLFCQTPSKLSYDGRAEQYPQHALLACQQLAGMNKPDGLRQLGDFYRVGYLVEKDDDKAADYYRRAYEHGDEKAGTMLMFFHFRNKQLLQGHKLATELAAKENVFGLGVLAESYFYGDPVAKDLAKAKLLAKKAAARGSERAYKLLMRAVINHDSLAPDYTESMAWVMAYKRNFKKSDDYKVSQVFAHLENTLSAEQQAKASKRSDAIIAELGQSGVNKGSVCIGDMKSNPELAGKKLSFKVNNQVSELPYQQPFQVRYLPPNKNHQLWLLVNGEQEDMAVIDFVDRNTHQLCYFFNEEAGYNEISDGLSFKECGCE